MGTNLYYQESPLLSGLSYFKKIPGEYMRQMVKVLKSATDTVAGRAGIDTPEDIRLRQRNKRSSGIKLRILTNVLFFCVPEWVCHMWKVHGPGIFLLKIGTVCNLNMFDSLGLHIGVPSFVHVQKRHADTVTGCIAHCVNICKTDIGKKADGCSRFRNRKRTDHSN